MRLSAANAMRFIDDIFDETMQALKDAGQWENTIVLLTSDNGGAIFPQSINNNYPLRGGKRSIFDGKIHRKSLIHTIICTQANSCSTRTNSLSPTGGYRAVQVMPITVFIMLYFFKYCQL